MNVENIAAIIFLIILTGLVYFNRKKLTFQKILFPVLYFVMWRTQYGLRFMDSFANRFRKPLDYLSYFIIFVGFAGMAVLSYSLIAGIIQTFTKPEVAPAVGLVLPIQAKGVFFVPFFYWIISIFILAVVHEFSHGIMARAFNIKIKSSGFAALGILVPIIPAAFVEPDERQLKKKPRRQQLAIFAAGSFANVMLALLIIIFSFIVINPIVKAISENKGVEIVGFNANLSPAQQAGMQQGEIITGIDGLSIVTVDDFVAALNDKAVGTKVHVKTNVSSYSFALAAHPEKESKAFIGVSVTQKAAIKESVKAQYGEILPAVFTWFVGLLFFLYLLNLGIGLFNLIPLGPIDGGRMMLTTLEAWFDEEKAKKIWGVVSVIFLLILLTGIATSFGWFR